MRQLVLSKLGESLPLFRICSDVVLHIWKANLANRYSYVRASRERACRTAEAPEREAARAERQRRRREKSARAQRQRRRREGRMPSGRGDEEAHARRQRHVDLTAAHRSAALLAGWSGSCHAISATLSRSAVEVTLLEKRGYVAKVCRVERLFGRIFS